jgi:hypothetical protein
MAGKVVSRELIGRVEALVAQILGPLGELRQYWRANSQLPCSRPIAATMMSRLPLSSTGIWLSSVTSPPPYTCPLASG